MHRRSPPFRFRRPVVPVLFVVAACVIVGSAGMTGAEPMTGTPYTVESDFKSGKARKNLSGAACAGSGRTFEWCLAVNDEKRWAQFFSIDGTTIVPKKQIWLLRAKNARGQEFDEIDAEGVAYDDGYLYVVSSHGLSRKGCKYRESQNFIFRFPVDAETGKPDFEFEDDVVASKVEVSARLRKLIRKTDIIYPYMDACLSSNGANFEGLAVADDQIYLGFRAPSLDSYAFVLEVPVDSVFGDASDDRAIHALKLGKGAGIRDLAAVNGGLLVLSGPAFSADVPQRIFFWDAATEQIQMLAEITGYDEKKAEALLVIDPAMTAESRTYSVLVFYDGVKNGEPELFTLTRE